MTRGNLTTLIESPRTRNAILAVIVINAIVLGLETSKTAMSAIGPLLVAIDQICLAIFVVEIGLKLVAYRGRFFLSGWRLFDFIIVGISLVPASEGLSVLRALRILRVLRAVSIIPSLRRVIDGLVSALPGMASVFALMSLLFYIASVMATKLFGAEFEAWFGTIGRSVYSLFQIMTLESWSMGIVRPVMEAYPLAWLFFIPFILVTTFAVVNLIVGLVVNSMQEAHAEESNALTDEYRDAVLTRLAEIDAKLTRLTASGEAKGSGGSPAGGESQGNRQDAI